MNAFVEQAAPRLGLSGSEIGFVLEANVRSYDSLHSLLLVSDELDADPGFRRDFLLQALEPLLSDAYSALLKAPRPGPVPDGGALASSPGAIDPGFPPKPPKDWPSIGLPEKIDGVEATDLVVKPLSFWLLRNQGGTATCVAHAAAAALERAQAQPGARPTLLSPVFLYNRMRDLTVRQQKAGLPVAVGAANGATKLGQAREILATEGICRETTWPHVQPLDKDPSAAARNQALAMREDGIAYWDIGTMPKRPPAVARAVQVLLAVGRPVAVSLPEFRPPTAQPGSPTNWWMNGVKANGIVVDPGPGWRMAETGHAVCILGFQPDKTEPLGGWFIFRNSLGDGWAINAPDFNQVGPPVVPGRGYGAISARYLNRFAWEIFSPVPR